MLQGILTVLHGVGSALGALLRTFPAALLLGGFGLLLGYTVATTPPLSYFLNERFMLLVGLVAVGAGLWLDLRRW